MKSKVWFITGASKGFGFEIARAVLASGDQVVATVRKNAGELAARLNGGDRALVVTLDVTNEKEVKAGVRAAIDKFQRIDVLVNNAGYGLLAATEEASAEEVRKQYDTNVFGLLNVTRAVLPQLRRQGSGHIINISSLFGYLNSVPGFGLYGSTKFAVEGISEGLVDASQNISTGHEDLSYNVSHCSGQLENYARLALSKAVLHALGCVATKIGLVDIVSGVRNVTLVIDLEQSIFQVEPGVIQGN